MATQNGVANLEHGLTVSQKVNHEVKPQAHVVACVIPVSVTPNSHPCKQLQ